MMDKSALVELFSQLPEDRMLQALAANGISISQNLMASSQSEDSILAALDASAIEPWNDVKIPLTDPKRGPIFDRSKVVKVDTARTMKQLPRPATTDPMLSSFEIDGNAQGGF